MRLYNCQLWGYRISPEPSKVNWIYSYPAAVCFFVFFRCIKTPESEFEIMVFSVVKWAVISS